ncbi:MAG: VCBS repeat-containing protein, partial [Phycisphaerales bacterium]|nr:VCBS repeat-containing protein [Phycisphaerales bacterium]
MPKTYATVAMMAVLPQVAAAQTQTCDPTEIFGPQQHYGAGLQARAIAIGDLDGDGFADLAVASSLSQDLSVLLNNGDGTFATEVRYAVPGVPKFVAIGDLDGDGSLDVVVADRSNEEAVVLLNDGDAVHAVPAAAVTVTHQKTNDPAKKLFSVDWTPSGDTLLADGA